MREPPLQRPTGVLTIACSFNMAAREKPTTRRPPAFPLTPARHRRRARYISFVMNPDEAAALRALQDDIYRERILRARSMTMEQRLAEVFAQSAHQFGMMLGGAMHRIGTTDESVGWREVRRWMHRLDRVREHGLYVREKPPAAL